MTLRHTAAGDHVAPGRAPHAFPTEHPVAEREK